MTCWVPLNRNGLQSSSWWHVEYLWTRTVCSPRLDDMLSTSEQERSAVLILMTCWVPLNRNGLQSSSWWHVEYLWTGRSVVLVLMTCWVPLSRSGLKSSSWWHVEYLWTETVCSPHLDDMLSTSEQERSAVLVFFLRLRRTNTRWTRLVEQSNLQITVMKVRPSNT
jgi:hypothetical protein